MNLPPPMILAAAGLLALACHPRAAAVNPVAPTSAYPPAPPGSCEDGPIDRSGRRQGTNLYGLIQGWDEQQLFDTVSLQGAARRGQALRLRRDGERVQSVDGDGAASADLTGLTLVGLRPAGGTVHLALCAPPRQSAHGKGWYRLEYYNASESLWMNACRGDKEHPEPLAAILTGAWDQSGAFHADEGRFTIACDTGVLGKCLDWGYDPAGPARGGVSMRDAHQACTRMARADYCGNGKPHTSDGSLIDVEDSLGIQRWDAGGGLAFEAAWGPDGAACLNHVRDGSPIDDVLRECPERFTRSDRRLSDGAVCGYTRAAAPARGERATRGPAELGFFLRNKSKRM